MTEVGTVVEPEDESSGMIKKRGGGWLPPLHRLKLPKLRTQTALVRWLFELGYEIKDIHKGLNIRYQQVRNMVKTIPKRAAREDLPPLIIELLEMEDVADMLLGEAMERDFASARKAELKASRQKARDPEELPGSELDDENYQEG